MTQSIIKDVDLNEYSKHETESLGDAGLFDLTRVRHITTSLSFSIVYFA